MHACRICAALGDHPTFEARDLMLGRGGTFIYFQCGSCGCLQIAGIPADMAPCYPEGYYSLQPTPEEGWAKRALKRARDAYEVFGRNPLGLLVDRVAPSIYMRALRIPGIRRSWRILDGGCGEGRNTVALGDIGFQNVTGVDPFIAADLRYPNGVTIRKTGLEAMSGVWDAIMFHHSFEHLPDPRASLRGAARLLAPGGTIVVAMPVVPCEAWERYGVCWSAMDPPRHLHILSRPGVESLADEAGLVVERVVYNSNAMQFWAGEQNLRGVGVYSPESYLINPGRSGWKPSQIRAFERTARRLNREGRGDQAVFYLRRAGV